MCEHSGIQITNRSDQLRNWKAFGTNVSNKSYSCSFMMLVSITSNPFQHKKSNRLLWIKERILSRYALKTMINISDWFFRRALSNLHSSTHRSSEQLFSNPKFSHKSRSITWYTIILPRFLCWFPSRNLSRCAHFTKIHVSRYHTI